MCRAEAVRHFPSGCVLLLKIHGSGRFDQGEFLQGQTSSAALFARPCLASRSLACEEAEVGLMVKAARIQEAQSRTVPLTVSDSSNAVDCDLLCP